MGHLNSMLRVIKTNVHSKGGRSLSDESLKKHYFEKFGDVLFCQTRAVKTSVKAVKSK